MLRGLPQCPDHHAHPKQKAPFSTHTPPYTHAHTHLPGHSSLICRSLHTQGDSQALSLLFYTTTTRKHACTPIHRRPHTFLHHLSCQLPVLLAVDSADRQAGPGVGCWGVKLACDKPHQQGFTQGLVQISLCQGTSCYSLLHLSVHQDREVQPGACSNAHRQPRCSRSNDVSHVQNHESQALQLAAQRGAANAWIATISPLHAPAARP